MSKKKKKRGKRKFDHGGDGDFSPQRPMPSFVPTQGPSETTDYDRDSGEAFPFAAPSAENATGALANRFIDLLERQLEAKDEQIRMMDARMQDAFEMQRALALIIRQYEQRTGISSDLLWDQVPEEELQRSSQAKPAGAEQLPTQEPEKPEIRATPGVGSENDPSAMQLSEEEKLRSFREWLSRRS